jgi:hypothetical protein
MTQYVALLLFAVALCVSGFLVWRLRRHILPKPKQESKCSNCSYFDLELGRAYMRQNPNFVQATQFLTPYAMNKQALYNDDGTPKLDAAGNQEYLHHISPKAKWDEFGACRNPRRAAICWGQDSCQEFTTTPVTDLVS